MTVFDGFYDQNIMKIDGFLVSIELYSRLEVELYSLVWFSLSPVVWFGLVGLVFLFTLTSPSRDMQVTTILWAIYIHGLY